VLICLLACYLIWHLRKAWAPMTFTDEHSPPRDNPVAAAQRSPQADAKASRKHDADGNPLRSFRGLLDHLATLTRNQVRYHGASTDVPVLADPTTDQRRHRVARRTTPPNQPIPRSTRGFAHTRARNFGLAGWWRLICELGGDSRAQQ
jgi:hypothetical protein